MMKKKLLVPLLLAADVAITATLAALRRRRNRPRWAVTLIRPGLVHVYPTKDGIEHDIDSDDCVCGPTPIPVLLEDGGFAWSMEHNALDGREFRERGLEVPRDVVR